MLQGFFVLINADIIFDYTISNLHISTITTQKEMFAIMRYEYDGSELNMTSHLESSRVNHYPYNPRFDSQDTWILHSNFNIKTSQEKVFNFEFGKPGCDNKIIYLMKILGYKIINDPKFIMTYHNHRTQIRDYTVKDVIPPPWGCVVPAYADPQSIYPSLGINLHEISKRKQYIGFEDNHFLREYIKTKLNSDQPFVIPRISGIENNIAYLALDSMKNLNRINALLPIMKSNAGIKMTSLESVRKYSHLYLEVFNNCSLFAGWEIQGNYIHHIAESHEFIIQQFSSKRMIWAFTFDIFHYIHSSPWTIALQGRRILIVSPFIESISENIHDRAKLYDGVDLFPNCSFLFIKPPITLAQENSEEFDVELDHFYKRLDLLQDKYDVALLSCGGYANPVCNYIYKHHNKSAIYVGGVLQMYFGILGNRWLLERKDAVNLYINEFWKRPKSSERPINFTSVENACYW